MLVKGGPGDVNTSISVDHDVSILEDVGTQRIPAGGWWTRMRLIHSLWAYQVTIAAKMALGTTRLALSKLSFGEYSNISCWWLANCIKTLRPRQNGRHFPDDIFKCIFLNENVWISIRISLKFVPWGPNNNFQALVQIMAWRRPGAKPLPELMMVISMTHLCVTRPQWVNGYL